MAQNLEVRLSFKPLFEGLNRFTSGIESRMEKVRALQLRFEKGAQQTNQILQTVATAASGAAIFSFFKRGIETGVDFIATLEQAKLGIAAVLKQFDETGKFKTFDDAIEESGKAIDLLKEKAISSPASFSSLVQAFQATAGPMTAANIAMKDQIKLIVNMSQALAGLGIREEQILQETRALITGNINADAAAAKILGITSADITAAKQSGELYEFLTSKISAFAEAGARGAGTLSTLKSNLGDAFEQRTADAAQGLTESLKRFYTEATEFVLSPTFTALFTTLADKVAGIVEQGTALVGWMREMSFGTDIFISLTSSAATWLVPLVAIGAALLVIRTSLGGLTSIINPLRLVFTFLSGVDFVDSVRDIQKLSKETGLLASFSRSGWGRRIAASITLIAGAAAGFAIGSALISAIENAELSRLERENSIREAMAGQTKELREQILAATTLKQLKSVAESAEKEAQVVQAQIANLEDQKAKALAAQTQLRAGAAFPGAGSSLGGAVFSSEQQVRLDALNQRFAYLTRNLERLRDPTEQLRVNLERVSTTGAREQISKLVKKLEELRALSASQILGALDPKSRFKELEAQRSALSRELATIPTDPTDDAKVDESNEARRLDLQTRIFDLGQAILATEKEVTAELDKQAEASRKRELFNLETRAIAAESSGNSALAEQLREEIERRELLNDLGSEHINLIEARLAAQGELATFELGLLQDELSFSRELGDLARERALIEADRYLTNEQKQALILPLLAEENRLIAARIAMMEQELLLGATDERRAQLQQKIDELRSQLAGNAGAQNENAPQGIMQGIAQGTVDFLDSIGTKAQQAARAVQSVWQATASNIQGALYKTFTGAISAGDGLKQIALGFGQAMLQSFSQMLADYAAKKAAMFAIDLLFSGKSLALSLASAAKSLVAWMPAAIAAAISSYGIAAAIGLAAVVGAIAAFATGGMVEGPGSGTSDSVLARLSNGEFVQPAAAVSHYGADFMESIRNRTFDPSGAVAGGLAKPSLGAGGGGGGYGGGSGSEERAEAQMPTVNFIQVQSRGEAERIRRDVEQRGQIARIIEEDFGIRRRRGA